MAYPVFPSLPAGSSVVYPDAEYERPNVKFVSEIGVENVRLTTSQGRFSEFTVIFTVPALTWQTIYDFILDRGLEGEVFEFTHPHYGTGLVRYASSKMPVATLIEGDPLWFRFEMKLRGQF